MTRDEFPEHLARGITEDNCVKEKIRRCAFKFETVDGNDYKETSIQWLDDDGAVEQMKGRMKGEDHQFRLGFAVIETRQLESLSRKPEFTGMGWIRAPSEGNEYHGLITCPMGINHRMLAAALAGVAMKYEFDEKLPVGRALNPYPYLLSADPVYPRGMPVSL